MKESKNKKIISFLLAVILCLSCIFLFCGCQTVKESEGMSIEELQASLIVNKLLTRTNKLSLEIEIFNPDGKVFKQTNSYLLTKENKEEWQSVCDSYQSYYLDGVFYVTDNGEEEVDIYLDKKNEVGFDNNILWMGNEPSVVDRKVTANNVVYLVKGIIPDDESMSSFGGKTGDKIVCALTLNASEDSYKYIEIYLEKASDGELILVNKVTFTYDEYLPYSGKVAEYMNRATDKLEINYESGEKRIFNIARGIKYNLVYDENYRLYANEKDENFITDDTFVMEGDASYFLLTQKAAVK